MVARRRKAANTIAQQRLATPQVCDEDVLAVLRRWYFKKNSTRTNVIPNGWSYVPSDTLGVVRTRTGTVVTTRMTKQHPSVFQLLCRWLQQQSPDIYKVPFPFPSISINHAYAAKKHRDGYNAGPSVLKTFGDFSGGQLLYWPNDDGLVDVIALPDSGALVFDAKREMLLFDGCRGHAVAPFQGERYSLVFFTATEYQKVTVAATEFLRGLGVVWPSIESMHYYQSILAPPRGSSKSIREVLGYTEKPAALQCGGKSLMKLADAVPIVLSFVLTPMDIANLCALSSKVRSWVWAVESWARTTIDTRHMKPCGGKAHRHWKLWLHAEYVLVGEWATSNVGLWLSKDLAVWRWFSRRGCPHLPISGKVVCVSQCSVPLRVTMMLERLCGEFIVVGLTDTREPRDIVEALADAPRTYAFFGVVITPTSALLLPNDTQLGEHISLGDDAFVTITLGNELLEVLIDTANSYKFSVRHGGYPDPSSERYCVSVSDVPCHIEPCWTRM